MGHTVSRFAPCTPRRQLTDAEMKSAALDAQLKQEQLQTQLDFKVLLLGAGESGKSTVVKQLRNIHKRPDYTDDELEEFKHVLQGNSIEAMRVLLHAIDTFEIELDNSDIEAAKVLIEEFRDDDRMTVEHADAITALAGSDAVAKALEHRHEIYFPDSGPYYFKHIEEFVSDAFKPGEEHIVMARVRTTGMFMTEFDTHHQRQDIGLHWRIVDVGGQRSERKKWIKFFDNVNAILFLVNLAGYNQVMFEDQHKNRLDESLELFGEVVSNPAFADTPVFLFLNKKDVFEEALTRSALTVKYPEYEGTTVHDALQFISAEFRKRMPDGKDLTGVQYVSARVKKDVRYAFDDVKESIVKHEQKNLKSTKKKIAKATK